MKCNIEDRAQRSFDVQQANNYASQMTWKKNSYIQ